MARGAFGWARAKLGRETAQGVTIGVSVPWKLGFPDNADSYRSRRRNQVERNATEREQMRMEIIAEVEARMKQHMDMLVERMEQRVKERVRAMRQPDAATTLESPSARHRSSWASAPGNDPDNMLDQQDFPIGGFEGNTPDDDIPKEVPGERYPIDDIEAATKCKLVLPTIVGADNIIEVGTGLAFPCGGDQTIHGLLLELGYARVSMDLCHRQPQGTNLCGFYVAQYMMQIVCSSPLVYPPLHSEVRCIQHIGKLNQQSSNEHVNMTVQTEEADVFDCIDINLQPAFDHPLLKNHKIQVKPSSFPLGPNIKSALIPSKLEAELCTIECPPGTIPILRNGQGAVGIITSLNDGEGQEAAAIRTKYDIYGAHATINIYEPIVNGVNGDRSAAWTQINNGLSEGIGAGSIVWPSFSGDNFARFHVYWVDSVLNKECYDLRCPGFVQVSQSVGLGGRIQPVSIYNGQQYVINVLLFKDPKTKNWWLSYGENKTPIGYWPSSLFTSMTDKADHSFVGGFVRGPTVKSNPPQMGSGHFASEGFKRAAFVENVQIVDENNNLVTPEPWSKSIPGTTREKCYSMDDFGKNDGGMHVYYGGPGGCT
ncbi:protein neprosin-like [Phragmites australis]|uniref:protein neprosin-like n=1 Tax=Phragmites australis TaxID=29695 RepID=UPI002D796C10|nr:protein neprosin-like [Phragmites australis]